jgi:rSAM/selenodomain-associated transferase 1
MGTEGQAIKGDLLLIQFAKAPEPGRVKTRMMPTLNDVQACELHVELLLWTCRRLCAPRGPRVELWVAGDIAHPAFMQCRALGVSDIRRQCGANLGERMANAIADGLMRYQKVVLVGSDCPFLDDSHIRHAALELDSHRVVLAPAVDGGYVLIGANVLIPELFSGKNWGQDTVYAETTDTLGRLGVNWQSLDQLHDIDRPEDLPLWYALKNQKAENEPPATL